MNMKQKYAIIFKRKTDTIWSPLVQHELYDHLDLARFVLEKEIKDNPEFDHALMHTYIIDCVLAVLQ